MPSSDPNVLFTETDRHLMRRALSLAGKGLGKVEPNPMVGCVLARAGRVVAEGYHRKYGGPHAEVDALVRAGSAARGATAYVTLEPCCHHGKTGPCTEALLAAGVARVVAAMTDPFPEVAGKGLDRLRSAGVDVSVGLLEDQARLLNAAYLKRLATGTPWVILKWAQSLDGRLATVTGHSQWITGDLARREAHRLRGLVDGVVVGAGTVASDDPQLTCRAVKPRRLARRIVVDGRLNILPDRWIVRTAKDVPTIVACTEQSAAGCGPKVRQLCEAGCEVLPLPAAGDGRIDLKALLAWCGTQRMTSVMVEGGGHLLGGFLDAHLVDELAVFVAPMLIGGGSPEAGIESTKGSSIVPAAVTPWPAGVTSLTGSPRLRHVSWRRLGDDLMMRGHVVWP